MYKLVPQKLVLLNTSAAGWPTREERLECLRTASPNSRHLERLSPGVAAPVQQEHSCAGLAVTRLQGNSKSCSPGGSASLPSEPTRNDSQAHRQGMVRRTITGSQNVSAELPRCFLENTLLQSCSQFLKCVILPRPGGNTKSLTTFKNVSF